MAATPPAGASAARRARPEIFFDGENMRLWGIRIRVYRQIAQYIGHLGIRPRELGRWLIGDLPRPIAPGVQVAGWPAE
jgi:hypothetical protein